MILLEMIAEKEKYFNLIKKEWLEARDSFPDFFNDITFDQKVLNEQYVQSITADIQKQFRSFPHLPFGRKKWRQKTLSLIKNVLYSETIIGLHNSMKQPTIDTFEEEVFDFLRHVRKFAPKLDFSDIGQAVRNYIVYAMFKKLHNVNTGFSMAAFGYSMLYPFTDNYIDNKKCSPTEKKLYNQIIRDKIQGLPVKPTIAHHIKTCDLLQAIEFEYPRELNSAIYQLLLLMLEAQEESMKQQNRELPLSMDERLDISVNKGGVSVLIDRFFVNNEITESDFYFYLAFGFFLQLADDLQDIKEDSLQGYSTLFTIDLHSDYEEKLVNKLLHFVHGIMDKYQSDNDNFKNFILSASYLLILSSTIGSKEFFSKGYLTEVEKYLPLPSPTLENYLQIRVEAVDRKLHDKYLKSLDGLL